MNKKRAEQLESLLDWEREGNRLPKKTELFNRQIGDTLSLSEVKPRLWMICTTEEDSEGNIRRHETFIKNATLVELGLTILDAIKITENRFIKSEG